MQIMATNFADISDPPADRPKAEVYPTEVKGSQTEMHRIMQDIICQKSKSIIFQEVIEKLLFDSHESKQQIELLRKENILLKASLSKSEAAKQVLLDELRSTNDLLEKFVNRLQPDMTNFELETDVEQVLKQTLSTRELAGALLQVTPIPDKTQLGSQRETLPHPHNRQAKRGGKTEKPCPLPKSPVVVDTFQGIEDARSLTPEWLLQQQAEDTHRSTETHSWPTHHEISDEYEKSHPLDESYSNSSESDYSDRLVKTYQHFPTKLRLPDIDLLAKDVECFDPENDNANIVSHFQKIETLFSDLPHATTREKLRLTGKTMCKSVQSFIETLPGRVRNSYTRLKRVLMEEYSSYSDETAAFLSANQIRHKRTENPREYYVRLRTAYFQGRNTSGQEEDRRFKSLFLTNLHHSIRDQVTLKCRTHCHTMAEMRCLAKQTWEAFTQPAGRPAEDTSTPSLPCKRNSNNESVQLGKIQLGLDSVAAQLAEVECVLLTKQAVCSEETDHCGPPHHTQDGEQVQTKVNWRQRRFPRLRNKCH